MQQQQDKHDILVTWRGKKYTVAIALSATLNEFGNSLQKLTDVKADTIRLIVRSSKSSTLLSPFSDEHSCLKLNETSILEGKSIMMMGAPNIEVEQVLQHAKANMRIAGFDEEEKRLRQRTMSGPSTPLKLPQGNYIFSEFRTLHLPGVELTPPASEALKLMHMLAADPGIVAIMNKHHWRVGIMTEMAPEGYVGVSPVCILGFNKNQGEEISLRLRTDDLKGFRKYQSIKKTLLHELAHMIYSDHDANFYALDKQLNQEADSLDWTRSRGHTLNGAGFSRDLSDEFYAGTDNGRSSQKLGGKGADQLANARSSSVAAAYRRLEKAVNLPGSLEVIEEHSNDVYTYQAESVHAAVKELNIAEGNQNHGECDVKSDAHNCIGKGKKVEPDPDDSGDREIMESEPYHEYKEGMDISEPDPNDSEMAELAPPSTTKRSLIEPGNLEVPLNDGGSLKTQGASQNLLHGDSEVLKGDLGSIKNHTQQIRDFVEPDPDDSNNGVVNQEPDPDDSIVTDQDASRTQTDEPDPDDQELQRIQDPVTVVCNRLQKAIKVLQSEVNPSEAVAVLQTLFKIIRNVIEHPDEIKFRKLRKANPMIQRNVANHKAAMEILLLIGFIEDVVMDEIGTSETYFILKRNDPGLLWLAKSSLETCLSY